MDTKKALIEKARATFPALYIHSAEDTRTLGDIKDAAVDTDRKLFVWTFRKGFQIVSAEGVFGEPIEETSNPNGALTFMAEYKESGKDRLGAFFVLRNFHHFMADPGVQAALIDMLPNFKLSKRMVVILSAVFTMPQELLKEFTLLETQLPDKNEIRKIVNGIITSTKSSVRSRSDIKAEEIDISDEHRDRVARAALGLTTNEAENAISLSFIRPRLEKTGNFWDPKIVLEEKCAALRKSGLLDYIPPTIDASSLGGMTNLKAWVKIRAKAFSDKAKEFGLKTPKGLLLVGLPGTGKSMAAKAISGELQMPLLKLDMGRVFGSLIGESEANIRRAIQIAEAISPCILWVDEIEKGLSGTNSGGDNGVSARVLATLLTWMQEKTAPVFVYATANDVSALPPELLRKGRFDEMFSVTLPSEEERLEIFRIHIKARGRDHLSSRLQLDDLSKMTVGFTGAEIEAVIDQAMFVAFDANKELNTFDLQEAAKKTVPLSRMMSQQIKAIDEWCKARTRPAGKVESNEAATVGATGRGLDA